MSLADYADRGALIGDLCGALKGARAPETEESGRYGLDRKTRRLVDRLARRLSGHLYFEHREQEDLADELFRAVNGYKRRLDESPRPKPKVLAAEFLDSLAQPPLNWQGFLGLRHLDLPSGTVVGQVRFLRADEEEGLAETFSRFGENAPRTVCTVSVVAGTDNIALERARRDAESALALVRQKVLHGFGAKMYPEQIAFSLTGHWAWKQDGRFDRSGWWLVDRRPIEMDLSGQPEWLNGLLEMSKRRESLSASLRERVDTGLDWLDTSARTETWRIKLPAVYSAMESLLVPEDSGRKAGAVTVRSVAVHAALEEGFFDPLETVQGYLWRSKLIHGAPTQDVNETELVALAEDRERWAFRVFADYLRLAERHGFESVGKLVSHLDKEFGDQVCDWLVQYGGQEVVDEYQEMLSGGKKK